MQTQNGVEKLKIMLKYQKSGDTALEFTLRDITQIFSTKASEGMLTIIFNLNPQDENSNGNKPASMITSKNNLQQRNVMLGSTGMSGTMNSLPQSSGIKYTLFLSKMEPQLV